MKQYLQQFTYATLTWLFLFVVDVGVELFQIFNETRTTLMGLVIQNIDTKETLTNVFSIDVRFYVIYAVFVTIWLTGYFLLKKLRRVTA